MPDRGYAQIADEQVMSRARFRAHAPRSLAANALQLAGRRGNVVASERYLAVPLASAAYVEAARFYFDSTPLEDTYWLSPVAAFWPSEHTAYVFSWYIVTQSSSGGNVDTSSVYTYTSRTDPSFAAFGNRANRRVLTQADASAIPLAWPLSKAEILYEQSLGWSRHRIVAALPTQGRVLSLWMKVATESGLGTITSADQILLRGATCFGVQR